MDLNNLNNLNNPIKKKRGIKSIKKDDDEIIKKIPKKRGRKAIKKDDDEIIKKIPKKRGRKPNKKNIDEPPKIPKKRGRKPKEKNGIIVKIPKKRGRKPKEKIYSVLKNNNNLNNLDTNIVIHMPLKEEDMKDSELFENNMFEYKPDICVPKPYEESIMDIKYLDNNNNDSKYALYETNKINTDIKDTEYNNIHESNISTINLKNNNDINISDISDINYNNNLISGSYIKDINNLKIWPDKTNQLCLWCCHYIDNKPIPLPVKKVDDIFYVTGYFCSYNCAASYNFDKNNNDKWTRYSLLNYLCKISNNTDFKKINLAPPRESLQIFGGKLLIDEFRKKSICNKKVNLLYPPLITIIPHIEEYSINKDQQEQKYIPINNNLMNKAINSLKLKRKNPISNNKTLKTYMSLKIQ